MSVTPDPIDHRDAEIEAEELRQERVFTALAAIIDPNLNRSCVILRRLLTHINDHVSPEDFVNLVVCYNYSDEE